MGPLRGDESSYYEETRILLERAYLTQLPPTRTEGRTRRRDTPKLGPEVAGETAATDTNGVVITRVARTSLPEAYYSMVSDTTLSPASLSGTQ